jgi:hypothetical protein
MSKPSRNRLIPTSIKRAKAQVAQDFNAFNHCQYRCTYNSLRYVFRANIRSGLRQYV